MNAPQGKKPLASRSAEQPQVDLMTPEIEQTLLRALRGLKYGQITIAVNKGRVTQVDRSEHTRQYRNKLTHR